MAQRLPCPGGAEVAAGGAVLGPALTENRPSCLGAATPVWTEDCSPTLCSFFPSGPGVDARLGRGRAGRLRLAGTAPGAPGAAAPQLLGTAASLPALGAALGRLAGALALLLGQSWKRLEAAWLCCCLLLPVKVAKTPGDSRRAPERAA